MRFCTPAGSGPPSRIAMAAALRRILVVSPSHCPVEGHRHPILSSRSAHTRSPHPSQKGVLSRVR
jgi:hypothetical protein